MIESHSAIGWPRRPPTSGAIYATIGTLLVLLVIVAAIGLGDAGRLAELMPVLGGALGLYLYASRPLGYITLVFWAWLLTPELRRLVDQQAGWSPSNPIMLTPYIITLVSAITLLRRPALLRFRFMVPLTFCLAGVALGYAVGIVRAGPTPALYGLLEWGTPLILAFHVAALRVPLQRVLDTVWRLAVAGCIALGSYGIVQFFWLPSWDAFWMRNAPITSIGEAEPLKVRVFSLLNSPGPLAAVLVTLLLLVALRNGKFKVTAVVLGSTALALSLVRSGWLALALGLVVIVVSRRERSPRATARTLLVVIPLLVLFTQGGPISDVIATRASSLGDVSQDVSFGDRVALYQRFTGTAISNPLGQGIGSTGQATKLSSDESAEATFGSFDSGVLELPFVLGWAGGFLFIWGVARLLIDGFRVTIADGRTRAVLNAVAVAGVSGMVFVNTLKSVAGVFIWLTFGLAIKARLDSERSAPGPDAVVPAVAR